MNLQNVKCKYLTTVYAVIFCEQLCLILMLTSSGLGYVDALGISPLLQLWPTLFFLKDYLLEVLSRLGPEYLGKFISDYIIH